jgi:polyketide synthase PksL
MHDISFSNPQVKERINFYSHISKAEAKEAMNNESQRWDRMEQRPVLADKTIIEGKERASVKLTSGMSLEYIQNQVIEVVKNILRYKDNEISTELSFSELGADSISGVEIIRDINTRFGTHLEAAEIYNHPNIKKLSAYIQEVTGNGYMLQINRSLPEKDIEITNTEHNYMEIVTDCYSNAFAEENHLSKAPEKVFTETEIKEKIVNVIKNILHLTENEIVSDKGFNEMGVDSISSVEIIRDINREYGLSLEAVTLYNYPNINLLAAYILSQLSSLTVSEKPGSGFNKPDNKREKTLELLRMLQDGILDINDVDRLTEEV